MLRSKAAGMMDYLAYSTCQWRNANRCSVMSGSRRRYSVQRYGSMDLFGGIGAAL